jgi:hypothetical protein
MTTPPALVRRLRARVGGSVRLRVVVLLAGVLGLAAADTGADGAVVAATVIVDSELPQCSSALLRPSFSDHSALAGSIRRSKGMLATSRGPISTPIP